MNILLALVSLLVKFHLEVVNLLLGDIAHVSVFAHQSLQLGELLAVVLDARLELLTTLLQFEFDESLLLGNVRLQRRLVLLASLVKQSSLVVEKHRCH